MDFHSLEMNHAKLATFLGQAGHTKHCLVSLQCLLTFPKACCLTHDMIGSMLVVSEQDMTLGHRSTRCCLEMDWVTPPKPVV